MPYLAVKMSDLVLYIVYSLRSDRNNIAVIRFPKFKNFNNPWATALSLLLRLNSGTVYICDGMARSGF